MRRAMTGGHAALLLALVLSACDVGVPAPPSEPVPRAPAAEPGGRPQSELQKTDPVVVRIQPTAPTGPLGKLFRPSAMLSWADAEAVQAFLALPGRLGTVRLTLEPILADASGPDAYRAELARGARHLKALTDRGAELIITIARMPRWLASSQEDTLAGPFGFSRREASPPRDYKVFEQLVYETVLVLNRDHGLSPLYEFWNEPNGRNFWIGTQDELFRTYAAFVAGARRADPEARVGGPAVGSWDARWEGAPNDSGPFLKAFFRYASSPPVGVGHGGRLPIDFVSWHNFGVTPEEGWEGVTEIKRWLAGAGYSPGSPQVVDEWNRWGTFPDWFDPTRDGALGAAYIPAALHEMDRAGVTFQAYAGLQDFNVPRRGEAFIGDFGLLTRQPLIKKAAFHVMNMLALLEDTRVQISVSPEVVDAEGLGVLATGRPGRVVALLHRFGGEPTGALIRSLRRSGYRTLGELGLPAERVGGFVRRETQLSPSEASPEVRLALERARAVAEKVRDAPTPEVTLRLQIQGWTEPVRYRIYRVDKEHGNPAETYQAARRAGRAHDGALHAARQREAFAPWAEGTGNLPELRLGRHAVVLVIVETTKVE